MKQLKIIISFILLAVVSLSCEKDPLPELSYSVLNSTNIEGSKINDASKGKEGQISICHHAGKDDNWSVININENAVQGHEEHGDVVLVDADGDGYVEAMNECVPGGDCDDNDPTVYPGATEICDNGIDDNCDGNIDEGCSVTAEIGDFIEGGVVFWIDPVDNTRGLVCAIEDQSTIQWYNGLSIPTGATDESIGAGAANTTSIINVQGPTETSYAAGIARAYRGSGHTDWFLPSKDELNVMYLNKAAINITAIENGGSNFSSYLYWSSSEDDALNAWFQYFPNGFQYNFGKNNPANVRAVRAF